MDNFVLVRGCGFNAHPLFFNSIEGSKKMIDFEISYGSELPTT